MFELEWHEWLPYLLSTGLLCTLVFAYSPHFLGVKAAYVARVKDAGTSVLQLPRLSEGVTPVGQRLVRRVKRKESPDDDSSACRASLKRNQSTRRGGRNYLCELIPFVHFASRTNVSSPLRYYSLLLQR